MKCYICGEGIRVKGANRRKVNGVLMHKLCPVESARRKAKKKEKDARKTH